MRWLHRFAALSLLLSIAWAWFLASLLPMGVCDALFNPLRAELRRAHTDDEAKHIAGRLCARSGAILRDFVALSLAPAAVVNGASALLLIAGRRRARVVVPPAPQGGTDPV